MAKRQKPLTRPEMIEILWNKGVLTFKLDSNQVEMQNLLSGLKGKIAIIGCSRRLGKSYFLTVLAIQTCLKKPNQIVKFIAPTTKDIRRIIKQLIKEITIDCPAHLLPKYNSIDNVYTFENGSEIQLAGTDNGNAESIRGTSANLCIIDEAGFCDELDYIVNSILMPMTLTTGGKIIMASTPSRSPDHPFMQFMAKAEAEGRFIKKTIYDNPRLTEKDIEEIAENTIGGKEGPDFRREYMVEVITSEELAVVPEFNNKVQENCIVEVQRPKFYHRYVSMDIGMKDLTVVLFGYYHFQLGKIVIEDEIILNGNRMLTDVLAALVKEKEVQLYKDELTGETKEPYLRVADNNNLILLNDLSVKHDLKFAATAKDNAEAALNAMRMLIKSERILISPKCKALISHLKNAIWNKNRTSYQRSADAGHFDAVDSLKYFVRNVNFQLNPFPHNYQMSHDTHYMENTNKGTNEFERALVNVFKERKRRGIT